MKPTLTIASLIATLGCHAGAHAQFGGFAPAQTTAVPGDPRDIVAADLDGDGDLDLAVPIGTTSAFDFVTILRNNGSGEYAVWSSFSVGGEPNAIAAGDVDLDGDIDLATANTATNDISLLRNNGDGTFLPETFAASGSGTTDLAMADFDGDGAMDIVSCNSAADTVSLFTVHAGSLNFVRSLSTHNGGGTSGDEPTAVIAVDLNRDGKPDLATANRGSGTITLMTYSGAPDGFSFFSGDFSLFLAAGVNPTALDAADIDKDGDLDYAVSNGSTGNYRVITNSGSGSAASSVVYSAGTDVEQVAFLDLDAAESLGDGDADLIRVSLTDPSQRGLIRFNDGAGGLATSQLFNVGTDAARIAHGDFDGDGDADVALTSPGSDSVVILLNLTNVVGGPRPLARIDLPTEMDGAGGTSGCLCPSVAQPIVGAADVPGGYFDSYDLAYRPLLSSTFTTIATSVAAVPDPGATLGTWNTTALAEGAYVLKLTARSLSGFESTDEAVVWVSQVFDSFSVGAMPAIVGGTACIGGSAYDRNCMVNLKVESTPAPGGTTQVLNNLEIAEGVRGATLATWNTNDMEDGEYDIRVSAANGCGQGASNVQRIEVDNTPPVATLTSPSACDQDASSFVIAGTAFDANLASWSLAYTGGDAADWVTIATGSGNVQDAQLAIWNVSSLRRCAYTIRLTVTDQALVNCVHGRSARTHVSVNVGCPGDFDGNGILNTTDVLAFLNAFTVGCP